MSVYMLELILPPNECVIISSMFEDLLHDVDGFFTAPV